MTVAGLAALALVFGALALLARPWRNAVWPVSLVGFLVLLAGSWSLPLREQAVIGGEALQSTGFLRLLLMLLAACGGTVTFVAAALGASRRLPAPIFLWFSATAAALALVSPLPAILLLTTGSLAAALLAAEAGGPEPSMVVGRGARAIVVAGALLAVAISWADLARAGLQAGIGDNGAPPGPGPIGLAFLAAGVGLVLRAGAIPLHVWSWRLAERLPLPAIPVTFAWGPAAFAVVLLEWVDPSVLALGQPLPVERGLLAAVAVASIMFGSLAAYLHDDLEHVVSYSLVTDTGVVLLGIAATTPDAWGPARMWILAYLVAKTALAAWATTARGTFGTNRIPELAGWARRAPLLAAALVAIALTAVGLPGMAAFDARSQLIALALPPPFDVAAWLGIIASAGYYLRILVIGLSPVSTAVATADHISPAWPGGRPSRLWPDGPRKLAAVWQLNRVPAAAAGVLLLAVLGLVVASGGLHAPGTASAPRPGGAAAEDAQPSESPAGLPTLVPVGSPSASAPAGLAPGSPAASGSPGGGTRSGGPGETLPALTVPPGASAVPGSAAPTP